jgi:alpha-galactosidase
MKKKLVLIGAGSAVFTKGLIADFIQSDFGEWEIGLCDINGEILEAVVKLAQKMVEVKDQTHRIKITHSTDRRDLLPGADFVVTTIAVGGRKAWEQDVQIPRKYGIYQPVGDSIMPGGIARAQRMIPQMIDIANDVKELCPDAFFFNYSNPMTAIVTAVRRATGVKLIGLCHGVIYGQRYLSRMMGVDVNRISTIGVGLNHLTFFYDIRVDGQDVKPKLQEIVNQQKIDNAQNGHEYNFFNSQLDDTEIPNYADNPLSWELFERYGALPAVVDRHAVEFFPERYPHGAYFGRTLGIDAFPIDEVIARGEKTYQDMLSQGEKGHVIDESLFHRSEGEHEELVEMIKSILLDERKSFSVNVPNDGAVKGIADDAVLELPAIATAKGYRVMNVDDFPPVLRGIINRRLASTELTVEAALTGNKDMWIEALLLDGAVTDAKVAEDMVDEFLEVYKDYLPQYKK